MLMYKEGEPLHELREFLTMDNGGPQCVEVRPQCVQFDQLVAPGAISDLKYKLLLTTN